MIYLDYSATTPMDIEVMDTYSKVCKDFVGNSNSLNNLGVKSNELLKSAFKQCADLLGCSPEEITFTSGATESNNFALIGAAMRNFKNGRHILVSKLEHPSIYAICDYLKTIGFEIEYINNDRDGLIDFEDLKNKLRDDTILVSIVAVNSELGIRQPLKMIRQIIKKDHPNVYFHSDMTQALGKISVSLKDVDMASFSFHKIYGPKGIGLFYKEKNVKISPLLYGSGKDNMLNPGTPALPLIVAASKAMRLALDNLEKKEHYISRLNETIVNKVKEFDGCLINNTQYSIPHILNISLMKIRPETFIHAMDKHEIYLSTNTACSSGNESLGVMALYNDKNRANHTVRISISSKTTLDEIKTFLKYFEEEYTNLDNLIK